MTVSPAQAVWAAYEQILENECVVTDTDKKALAAAILVIADLVVPEHREHYPNTLDEKYRKISAFDTRNQLLAVAGELKGYSKEAERPDRLIKGDVWEFEWEVREKGKRKPVFKKLQFKVIGYHHGQCAWQLTSLDGEHYCYLFEFAPRYEDMTYIGNIGAK